MSSNRKGAGNALRFAVITDAHVEHSEDERVQYLRVALDAMQMHRPAFVVFAGDLVSPPATRTETGTSEPVHMHSGGDTVSFHAAATRDFSWTHDLLKTIDIPVHLLRGNVDVPLRQEPLRFAFAMEGIAFIGFDTAMGTLDESEDRWLRETSHRFADMPKIFFSHYYVDALEPPGAERLLARLAESGAQHLISGHGHRCEHHVIAQTQHHLVEAIDPFKPGSHRPGFEIFDFEGGDLHRTHHTVSVLDSTSVQRFKDFIGCAPYDPGGGDEFHALFTDCGLCRAQCRLTPNVVQSLGGDQAVANLRRWLEGGTLQSLSVHGSNPRIDQGGHWLNRSTIEHEIGISRETGAVSVTSHLPVWDDREIFDRESGRPTSVAHSFVDVLAEGLSGYWQGGIRIDLENTHWLDPAQYPDSLEEHMLGIQIHHLLWFREQLESRLKDLHGEVSGAGVAFTFDVGHALTNGPLASTMTLPDWFASLGSRIRSIHLHDVVDLPAGGRQAHLPMGVAGGLVGLEGLIHLWHRYSPDAILYLEVETLEDVRRSVEHLRNW
jgi:predicted phosphodiesterase